MRNVPSYALSRYALSSVCRLDYPITLIYYTINMFIQNITTKPEGKTDDGNTIRIVLLFKDQIAANAVCRRLRDLSNKIAVTFQPLFVSKKFEHDKPKEIKPSTEVSIALFTNLHVICVMQIILATQSRRHLPSSHCCIQLSVNIFRS